MEYSHGNKKVPTTTLNALVKKAVHLFLPPRSLKERLSVSPAPML